MNNEDLAIKTHNRIIGTTAEINNRTMIIDGDNKSNIINSINNNNIMMMNDNNNNALLRYKVGAIRL